MMINILNNLETCESYFKGFHDIAEHRSSKQVLIGALKIASYATLIFPMIAGVSYLVLKLKFNSLLNLNTRVIKSLNPDNDHNETTQNDYLKFLTSRVQDEEYGCFEAAFNKLNTPSQETFFSAMAANGKLKESLEKTPKNLTQISFSLGRLPTSCETDKKIKNIFKTLEQFTKLKTINLDLRKTAYCSLRLETKLTKDQELFKKDTTLENVDISYPKPSEYVTIGNTAILNNYGAAFHTARSSAKLFSEIDSLEEIRIDYTNKTVSMKKDHSEISLIVDYKYRGLFGY